MSVCKHDIYTVMQNEDQGHPLRAATMHKGKAQQSKSICGKLGK